MSKAQQPIIDTSWMEPNKMVWVELPGQASENSDKDIFLKARLQSFDKKKATYTLPNGQTDSTDLQYLHERSSEFTDDSYKGQDDMVNMEIINDIELLMNLRVRYSKNLIFTYVGPTLLVVNPFQSLPEFYELDIKYDYIGKIIVKKGGHYKELPPHLYAIAAEAYRGLFENEKNQSIVISGESGAGKTEGAKICMNLLTSIGQYQMFQHNIPELKKIKSQSSVRKSAKDIKQIVIQQTSQIGIEDKILSCNPILEAFGNAKTVRNNNSSRFGKYVSMVVSQQQKKIKGALIINYLLEKSRIVSQGPMERNFHIFYHFLKGMTQDELAAYELKGVKFDDLNYIKKENKTYDVKGVNDEQLYHEFVASVELLGFSENFVDIFKIVAAILILGNFEIDGSSFENNNPCTIMNKELLEKVGRLLEVESAELSKALTFLSRKIQQQVILSPLTKVQCEDMRDSLAKDLYERLFNWLVEKLNLTIQPQEKDQTYYSVGLLDIYGFEVFDCNGFEQMMINYTNEKLHQLYIEYVFKEEENIFIAEGLQEFCGSIQFNDNQDVMNLMDKYPTGIFDLLDECCQVKSDDDGFLQKIRKQHKTNPLLLNPKMISKPTFIVVHTAKEVEYTVNGFREKNKDELSNLIIEIVGKSRNELIARLFTEAEEKGKKDKTLSKKIRSQMVELMNELRSCDVHFIRCIKPNDLKVKQKLVQDYTLNQIRYLGILDSLKIRKKNYPIRRTFQLFYKKYGDMTKNKTYPALCKDNADFRPLVVDMFKQYFTTLTTSDALMGNRKIFLKLEAMPEIERVYQLEIQEKHKAASKFQRSWKRYQLKKGIQKFMKLKQFIKNGIKEFRLRIYYKKKMAMCVKIQRCWKRKVAKMRREKYRVQLELLSSLIQRTYAINRIKNVKKSILRIQKFVRFLRQMKEKIKKQFVKKQFLTALDNAWLIILNKKATIIQKWFRGYIVRKKNKKQIKQIEEAGRQCKIRKIAVKIQKVARGYLVRKQLKKMHRAAFYIQGFFKMTWLSGLFDLMRAKIVVIQHQVRTFLAKRRAMKEKYLRYVLPMEKQLARQKMKEEQHLFGVGEAEELESSCEVESAEKKSPFQYRTPSPQNRVRLESPEHLDVHGQTSSFDEMLSADTNLISAKVSLFGFIVDLEVLVDTSEYFRPSFAKNYKKLFESTYQADNYLQTFHVGGTHAFATSSSGKVYGWGMNDFHQLGLQKKSFRSQRPTALHGLSHARIHSIAAGTDHTLFLCTDGQVLLCGSNEHGQQLKDDPRGILSLIELPSAVKQVGATNHTSFLLTEEGKLYTWPVGDWQSRIPYEIDVPTPVAQFSIGHQFAILVCTNGNVYSFGQNDHGQLGQGHKDELIEAQLVKGLTHHKFTKVSCGFKHVVALTSLHKIFVWGWGEYGQLAAGNFHDALKPTQLDIGTHVTDVAAALKTTLLLVDNSYVLWSGTNGTISYQSTLAKLKISAKCPVLNNGHFSPIKVHASYSKSLSIIYLTYVNHKGMWKGNPKLRKSVLHTLTSKWTDHSVDPPLIDSISKYISEQHMKLPAKSKIHVQTYRSPRKYLIMRKHSESQQDSEQEQDQDQEQDKRLHEFTFQNVSPQHRQDENSKKNTQEEEKKQLSTIISVNNIQQQEQYEQEEQDEQEQEEQEEKEREKDIKSYSLVSTEKKSPKVKKYELRVNSPNRLRYQKSEHSPRRLKNQKSEHKHKLKKKGKKDKPAQEEVPQFYSVRQEQREKSNEKSNEKLNEKSQESAKQYQSEQGERSNSQAEQKLRRLREVKSKLLKLKTVPEKDWSKEDQEFIKNIYSQNLNLLLEKIA